MLGHFFKPRWQHKQAAQRLRAVAELAPSDAEHQRILSQLASSDPAVEVRLAAIAAVTELGTLDTLTADPDHSIADAARQQLQSLLAGTAAGSPALEVRKHLVTHTDHLPTLLGVVQHSPDSELRLLALSRIEHGDSLLELALQAPDAALRLAAAQRLSDSNLLRRLIKDSRDKRVQQWAREQSRRLNQAQQAAEERSAVRSAVTRELQQHRHRPLDSLYRPRLTQLQQQWIDAADGAEEAEYSAFRSAVEACDAVMAAAEAALAAEQAALRAAQEQQTVLAELVTLCRSLDEAPLTQALGSFYAAQTLQQRHWDALAALHPVATADAERFTTLIAALGERLALLSDLQADAPALQALLDDTAELPEQSRATVEAWLTRWPQHLPQPTLLQQLAKRVQPPAVAVVDTSASMAADRPTRSAHQQQIDQALGQLQRALQQRNLRQANRLWQRLEALLAEQPDASRQARLERLQPERDELRDWHAFAAEPKKIELCDTMEQLADAPLDAEEQASAIQALHEQWRALMSSDQDADQALWERFKTASDRAYAPCQVHFDELDALRSHQLAARAALCDQLEALLAAQAEHSETDWPALFLIRRQAPAEFRALEPVRFNDARPVNRRFSQLLKALDQRLEQASNTHAALLEQQCAAVEALLANADVRDAAEQVKPLQRQWKQAGWVHPRQYRGLHKRFRSACDQLFQRRDEQRQALRATQDSQQHALRAALDHLDSCLAAPTEANVRAALTAVDALPAPRREGPLHGRRERGRRAAQTLLAALPQLARREALRTQLEALPDRDDDSAALRELVIAIEVTAEVPSPEEARAERMQWQLGELSRAMTGGSNQPALERCEALLAAQQPLLAAGLTPALRQRLLQAVAALV
ncbi:DUF349 domain-containing protein [Isoalcanivorax beigongshangi]|uniref:DUF349 domain-containing protein n=1 Tax=Isoalcanivorax beigongshangi TaxID=3238810 RepID=A0ABV4AKA1_9GAMM